MEYGKRVKVAFGILILLGFVLGAIIGASLGVFTNIQKGITDIISKSTIEQTQKTSVYPATCDETSKSVLAAVGGCSIVDCKLYSNICEACCPGNT